MDNTIMQAGLWVAAGLLLILFMSRRRKRRTAR
jgi:LPXTG-motif cell wall-anchored protein